MKKIFRITRETGIPLVGLIQIGIIDRGTNLLQVRPTSVCNLNCVYCSTDSGANSVYHVTDYVAELDYFLDWLNEVVDFKVENGCSDIELNLDSCGEVLTYADFLGLVEKASKIKSVKKISMQTNGMLLDEEKIRKLEKLGINQINLSLNSFDDEKCKMFSGCENYDVNKIIKIAKTINKTKIKLLIAPIWLSGLNDKDITEIIKWCKKLGCKIGIQNYEIHKYGRKAEGVKKINYKRFYEQLEKWKKEFDVKLKINAEDLKIKKCKRIPYKFRKGEIVEAEIKANGWMENEMIGVARNRALTIFNCNGRIGQKVRIKITEISNGIYLGRKV